MRRAYAVVRGAAQLPLAESTVVLLALTIAVGAQQRSWYLGVVAGVLAGVVAWVANGRVGVAKRRAAVVLIAGGCIGGMRGADAWSALTPDRVGAFAGWAQLVDDPQPFAGSTRILLEVDDQRFEMWARGRAMRLRVGEWRGGDLVQVSGTLAALDAERQGRVAWQHVVGEFELDWVADVATGGPLARASNRVRAAIERGGSVLPGDDGSLFRGLVVGDDRDQPPPMIDRFRASGLSHLTAVSGQNVSFVLVAAGPLLRAIRPWVRWAVTLALIGWFVSLTRFEPSIVRAGTMAAISATAFVSGRERSPSRVLWIAVCLLLLVDPLIVGSVGFWLSVGATAGVVVLGPRLAKLFERLGFIAMPLGVTLGAQAGVIIPSVLVFGRLPLVSVPANLLAVPVAGFVMLYGLPAGLLAGACAPLAPIVMFPCRLGVRWVDTVAALGARLEPGGIATWVGWAVAIAVIGAVAVKRWRTIDA